jgi:hypothetical protein
MPVWRESPPPADLVIDVASFSYAQIQDEVTVFQGAELCLVDHLEGHGEPNVTRLTSYRQARLARNRAVLRAILDVGDN